MLFNKKAEDEFTSDFVTGKRSMTTPGLPADQAIAAARKTGGTPTRSVINSWLTITGNLESEGEVQVDGQIHGHIRCTHLTVGRDATIEGNITADEVVVRGTVKGLIRANRVILQDSAHVRSEIYHKKLAIEEGASFEGNSRRCEDPLNVAVGEVRDDAAEVHGRRHEGGAEGQRPVHGNGCGRRLAPVSRNRGRRASPAAVPQRPRGAHVAFFFVRYSAGRRCSRTLRPCPSCRRWPRTD